VEKRAASGKVSDTKKKKEIAKKAKNARRTSEKAEKKKRKTAPKTAEKHAAGKVKGKEERRVKKVKGREKQKTVREKISPGQEKKKKVEAKGKSEKKIAKTEGSSKKKTKKVAVATRKIKKAEEKTPPQRRKKVPSKVAGEVRISKAPSPKTAEKAKAGVITKAEISKEKKTSGRIVKEKVVSAELKKVAPGKTTVKSEKNERQQIVRGVGEAEALGGRAKAGQDEAGRVAEAKEIAGLQKSETQEVGEKEAHPPTPRAVLPEEYGENSVTLMTVDPYRLFAFWEVREEALEIFRGQVDIRVYDVTDIDFDMMDANSYIDVRADARVGKCYVSVNPEREYTADIGIIFDGIFIAIARSARVSTPRAAVSEEGILLSGPWATGLRTGY
jgi:hypothetical protein